jgi:hypothetical protein
MGDDVSSNLANFLKDISKKNAEKAQLLGDFIGTVADVSAVVSTIISVVGFFENMGADPLQPIVDELRRDFQQLGAELKAENIITRRTNQVNALGPARAILADLNNLINLQPPLTEAERSDKVETCITTLNDLSPEDPLWMAPFNDQIFWTDAGLLMWVTFAPRGPGLGGIPDRFPLDLGYGEQAPTAQSTGEVFNYFYILPAYVEALFIFIAVAAALFPSDFAQRFADVLKPAADLLQARHDRIMSGITQLFPGQLNRQMLIDALNALAEAASGIPVGTFQSGVTPFLVPPSVPGVSLSLNLMGGVNIEYGAVERFSGFSSIGLYKMTIDEINAMDGDAAFNKFRLRLLKRAKDVYIGVGLRSVWNIINDLKGIVGDAPLPRPNFADWSVRNILSTARIPAREDGSFHLLDLVHFIQRTVPQDTTTPTSFRGLLV